VIAPIVHCCYRLAKLGMDNLLQWLTAVGCCLPTIWPKAEICGEADHVDERWKRRIDD
jgi:hypothetical protein